MAILDRRWWTAIAISAMLTGCQNLPPPVAPPEQRQPLPEFRAYRIDHVVKFSEGNLSSVVRDILAPAGGWSWTNQNPAVRVAVRSVNKVRYLADFAISETTFAATGPVSVTFLVNDRPLETVRYTSPGPRHFEKAVPSEWLRSEAEILVAASVDKVWVSPEDGAKLGLILTALGVVEE